MHVESVKKAKKAEKKQRRCLAIIKSDCQVEASETPTRHLAVLNVGLSNGLSEEVLLEAAFATGGKVSRVEMCPGKSYCFLTCCTPQEAQLIFKGMHNIAHIGQDGAVAYMSYVKEVPIFEAGNQWNRSLPNGLVLLKDFVSEAEEADLLAAVASKEQTTDQEENSLKHRKVRHFGYEFLYGTNNVDPNRPLEHQPIPRACNILWSRLGDGKLSDNWDWSQPDQLTVNVYEPGHGIPPHVDTHSAFLDPILSLSLQSDVVMDFRRGQETISLLLPRRSLLIMSGEARYDWTHGIKPKHLDVVPTAEGNLTTQARSQRTSLTFRCLRQPSVCSCSFPQLCDTRQSSKPQSQDLSEQATSLEQQNVHEVYDKISQHFSETRHSPWPQVVQFLDSFEPHSTILDVGCGNGKYLNCNTQLVAFGCDRSQGLLEVGRARGFQIFRCDCLSLPVRSASMDGCLSIAVIHHLATPDRRLAALREMARVLRPGGRALVYVWAKDQRRNDKKSAYLRQNKAVNRQRTTEEEQRQKQQKEMDTHTLLPIHTNRTEFQQQDVLVPWKTKDDQSKTFLRYYHVFEEQELEQLVNQINTEVELIKSYYDQGNHCVIFKKL
ncbi:alkylated DNA repair protein alkB homolog 8 [Drosophila willistoni]|uniref:alkylated DNA repair protein alkB homolog 8 n=1 Tax=Drosophila willistoni TaxID=7260 RepID=UPI001F079D67|nr:alkylated DNA repair protein alkB homolog 8 [Drosophila willistoni]